MQRFKIIYFSMRPCSGHDPYRTPSTGNGSHHWFLTSPTHLLSANVWGPVVGFAVSVLVANVNHYFFWHNSLSPGNIWGLHVSLLCYFQFQIQFGIFMATMLHAVFFFNIQLFACSYLFSSRYLLYPLYPKDRGMLWFYVEAARHPPPAMVLTR